VVNQDIQVLMQQSKDNKLAEFISLYDGYALVKYGSHMKSYIPQATQDMCKTWCDRFNMANYALDRINEDEEKNQSQ
jgi:hypothetical protein